MAMKITDPTPAINININRPGFLLQNLNCKNRNKS